MGRVWQNVVPVPVSGIYTVRTSCKRGRGGGLGEVEKKSGFYFSVQYFCSNWRKIQVLRLASCFIEKKNMKYVRNV